ncbi:MAG: GNAT family N-acetyltransferase [Opitutales bacterium]
MTALTSNRAAFAMRPVTASDREDVSALVDAAYREIGDRVFLQGYDVDLTTLPEPYLSAQGAFMVCHDTHGRLAGTHAVRPLDRAQGVVEFKRFYVRRDLRGQGLGRKLMDWAVDWARAREFQRVEFWSDTRFSHAHALFEHWGFQRGAVRTGNDGSMPYQEYHYSRKL